MHFMLIYTIGSITIMAENLQYYAKQFEKALGDRLGGALAYRMPRHDLVPLHGEEVVIDPTIPLCEPGELGINDQYLGGKVSVFARLALPVDTGVRQHMAILKTEYPDKRTDYWLQGLKIGFLSGMLIPTRREPLRLAKDGTVTTLGRGRKDDHIVSADRLWDSGSFTGRVSRSQLGLWFDKKGHLNITETSTNGSWAAAGAYIIEPDGAREYERLTGKDYSANYTEAAVALAGTKHLIDAEGKFAGRNIITHTTEIGGYSKATVDIRSWMTGSEATIVDATDPHLTPELTHQYDEYRSSVFKKVALGQMQRNRALTPLEIGAFIKGTIRERMDYDPNWVEKLSDELSLQSPDHRTVNLATYMYEGKGVCRQMGILAAWLGGELKAQGIIDKPTVALVNMNVIDGGHEAAIILGDNPDGSDSVVIDPAMDYVGPPLAEHWDYRTPEQKKFAIEAANLHDISQGLMPKLIRFLSKHGF